MTDSPEPLVLASNRHTASGHEYADRTGISYEYPTRYRSLIVPGAPFVYYRSREGSEPPHYFGAGVVGAVRVSSQNSTRLECDIVDYRPFERAIPFRDLTGDYLEENGARRGYYQPGVRRITDDELEAILALAEIAPLESEIVAGDVASPDAKYGTTETSRVVEEYAVEQVAELLRERHGPDSVRVMPRNNRGYDIRLTADGELRAYVEVKGTTLPAPVFFLTESERAFSAEEAARYSLFVVYSIDLDNKSHEVIQHDGELTMEGASLAPFQWRGRLGTSVE